MDIVGSISSIAQIAAYALTASGSLIQLLMEIRKGPAIFGDQKINLELLLRILVDMPKDITCAVDAQQQIGTTVAEIESLATHILRLLNDSTLSLLHKLCWPARRASIARHFQTLAARKDILHFQIAQLTYCTSIDTADELQKIKASNNVVDQDSSVWLGCATNTKDAAKIPLPAITWTKNKVTNGSHGVVGPYNDRVMQDTIGGLMEARRHQHQPRSNHPSQDDYPIPSTSNITANGHRVTNSRHVRAGAFNTAGTDRSSAQSTKPHRIKPMQESPKNRTRQSAENSYSVSHGGNNEARMDAMSHDAGVFNANKPTITQYEEWSSSPEPHYRHKQSQPTYDQFVQSTRAQSSRQDPSASNIPYDAGARQIGSTGRHLALEYKPHGVARSP